MSPRVRLLAAEPFGRALGPAAAPKPRCRLSHSAGDCRLRAGPGGGCASRHAAPRHRSAGPAAPSGPRGGGGRAGAGLGVTLRWHRGFSVLWLPAEARGPSLPARILYAREASCGKGSCWLCPVPGLGSALRHSSPGPGSSLCSVLPQDGFNLTCGIVLCPGSFVSADPDAMRAPCSTC